MRERSWERCHSLKSLLKPCLDESGRSFIQYILETGPPKCEFNNLGQEPLSCLPQRSLYRNVHEALAFTENEAAEVELVRGAENFHFLVSADNGLKHASEQMIKGVCDASWSERQQPLGDKILAFGEGHLWWIKETENPWISNWTGESVHYALVGGLVKMRRILSVLSRNCVILKTREEQSCCSSLSP